MNSRLILFGCLIGILFCSGVTAADDTENVGTVEADIGASREASRTDDETLAKEEEAIKLDGLSVAQMKEVRNKSEKFQFQAEVNRMMKLIINSLYRNKEIFLRELISNASDALDKIRLISLTEKEQFDTKPELTIHIKADKDSNVIHITDTGIGMTREHLVDHIGTIAKSGTSDFFSKLQEAEDAKSANDLIGQFGVGFYSSFLVSDRVVVTTKHNDDKQYIWESDSSKYSIAEDPRGNTLGRGTTISLFLKKEARDFVEIDTVKNLIKKYSQFINFPIYLWESKTEEVEEPLDEEEEKIDELNTDKDKTEDEEGVVEEDKDDKPKTKKVSKTTWDWVLLNNAKPIWTKKPAEIDDAEYEEFYKNLCKDTKAPLTKTHFIAEGEVTFKALLFLPESQPTELFNKYGTKTDNIKLYVRRVFITDDFQDMMPNYLAFIRGIVDSDDLPLNVSREMLQQHKLLKIIKKKLVRKTLDMLKKMEDKTFDKFWAEYSTNIKLGVIEDSANRNRLAKLLKFHSSNNSTKMSSLADYIERMKEKQEHIFYMAGGSRKEVENSPFVERLIKKSYEVLYLTEAIDEYAVNALPEFEGKKFQNVAKEGLSLDEGAMAKERLEKIKETFEPLTKWLSEEALKEQISKAEISERLEESPCALVSSRFGWTANMERIVTSQTHSKTGDTQRDYYLSQKKTLEINPRHPLMKELLKRIKSNPADKTASEIAIMMFRTATLRSGYMLKDTPDFAKTVEEMMRQTLGVPLDAPVEEEVVDEELPVEEENDVESKSPTADSEMHDEL